MLSPVKELQSWMGSVLRTPLQKNDKIHPRHKQKAADLIPATPTLKPHERLEIYNQQYWWRLYKSLQDVLPAVAALLGKERFNKKIAAPYLQAFNPSHYTLYFLGTHLLGWLQSYWKGDPLILKMAKIDFLFYEVFLNEVIEEPLDPEKTFYLQPHVRLFFLEEDLLSLRYDLLQGKGKSPLQKKAIKAVIYRIPLTGKTYWEELSEDQYSLLQCFQKGATLEEALPEESNLNVQETFAFFSQGRLISNVRA